MVADKEPWARIATNKQQNSTMIFLQINLVVKDQTTFHHANRAIQGNVAMHVTLPGGQLRNQCKWFHLVATFATNASGAIWWLNLQLKQVAPCGGQIWN